MNNCRELLRRAFGPSCTTGARFGFARLTYPAKVQLFSAKPARWRCHPAKVQLFQAKNSAW
jgi:hypothetical protein